MSILSKKNIIELVRLGVLETTDENGNPAYPTTYDVIKKVDISQDKAVISTQYLYNETKKKQFIVQLNNISNEDITSLVSIKTLGFISNINKMIRFLYIIGIINVVGIVLWILLSVIGASSSPRY